MLLNNKALVGGFALCGVIILVYAVTITIIYAINKSNENEKDEAQRQKNKCESYGCVQTAAQIANYIDESIDPCDNFYQFANGKFIKEMTDDVDDWESQTFYSTVEKLVNNKIGPLLSGDPPKDWKIFRLAKNYYQSCLIEEDIVTRQNEQMTSILRELGGWPVVEGSSWLSSNFDLIEIMRTVKDKGFETNMIFTLDVDFDPKNSTNRRLVIRKGNYDERHEEDDDEYWEKMLKIPTYFMRQSQAKTNYIHNIMAKVYNFELKLSTLDIDGYKEEEGENDDGVEENENEVEENNTGDDEDVDDESLTTIKRLQESYPIWNWEAYINAILPKGLDVNEDEPIVNENPKFFMKLKELLEKTQIRTLANYIVWRVVYSADGLKINEIGKSRRNKCVDLTSEKFSIPVSLLYSLKYFNQTAREAAITLVEDVRNSFIDMLSQVTWMDNETRAKAIEKAENIVAHVGYPNGILESHVLHEYYGPLEMEPNNFFLNSLNWNRFTYDDYFKKLRIPFNRSGWEIALIAKPNEANAFYHRPSNSMTFLAAILHEKFFSVDRPNYINYASFGYTVGHEITHGFDSNGKNYDLNGNLVNWWNNETERKFTNRTECFEHQYDSFVDAKTERKVDGKRTLDENIADNGGTKAAYYAYQNWNKRNKPEQLVPGIQYNQNQLFWISYAQAMGDIAGINLRIIQISTDEHAPAEFRINGVVSNTVEFAKDFKCKPGTKMNPAKKCKIW